MQTENDMLALPKKLQRMQQTFLNASVDLTAELTTASAADSEDIHYIIGMCALNAEQIDAMMNDPKAYSDKIIEQFIADAEKFETELWRHGFGQSKGGDHV